MRAVVFRRVAPTKVVANDVHDPRGQAGDGRRDQADGTAGAGLVVRQAITIPIAPTRTRKHPTGADSLRLDGGGLRGTEPQGTQRRWAHKVRPAKAKQESGVRPRGV